MRPTLLDLGLFASPPAATLPRVLVLGDADFAYARALQSSCASSGLKLSLFASAFEPEAELASRYPEAVDTMGALTRAGAAVRCGIDARTIAAHYGEGESFDRIVFNLPQSPPAPKARNQIQRHRALLRDFCGSAAAALAPRGQLWITLLAGQGGTPLDPIQRAPGDTWMVQHEAARSGLLVTDVHAADMDTLERGGYTPTGRGRTQPGPLGARRKDKGLVVHVLASERPSVGDDEAAQPRSVAPMEHTLDNSFWLDAADASAPDPAAADILTAARTALGPDAAHVISEEPTLVDSYARPEDGRRARTYRFVYRSSVLALGKDRALALNGKMCAALAAEFGGEYRNKQLQEQQQQQSGGASEEPEDEGVPDGGSASTEHPDKRARVD